MGIKNSHFLGNPFAEIKNNDPIETIKEMGKIM